MRIAKIMSLSCIEFSLNLIENGTFYVNLVLKRQKWIVPTIVTEEPGKVKEISDRYQKKTVTL